MPNTLLATKLHIPRLRRDLVPRPRLMERLDAGLQGKLTLVSAPAGYGKTTLVADWIDASQTPTAWLSLDEADNDPARFLTYVIAALQGIDDKIGIDVQAALTESRVPQGETLLTRLVTDIAAATGDASTRTIRGSGGREFVLVLDDYHLITTQTVHDALNFLLEHLPEAMHLLVAGRSDPPLPISRLRVQGEITEMRTPELRFTGDEAATLLNDLMGLGLSSGDIAALEARTEGWVASLQLAALSLRGRPDKREFVEAFSGSHRYVIDYLVDEVLGRQSEGVQAFLVHTSVLDRFCAPLCDAVCATPSVSGGDDAEKASTSQRILRQLEDDNLFLVPLDDERRWFRYHHLFAGFLQQRLLQSEPEWIPELHRRASQWYEDEGLVDQAIRHALKAGNMERATRLVGQIAVSLVVRREANRLLRLVDLLPPTLCNDSPMLCLWHAWALVFAGELDNVESVLQSAEAHQGPDPKPPPLGYATTVRAYLANQRGNLQEALGLARQALEQMKGAPADQTTLIFQGAAVIWLGVNHRLLGDLDQANELFAKAATLNQKAGNFYGALASVEQAADVAEIQGRLHQAAQLHRRGLQMAERWSRQEGMGRGSLPAATGPYLGLGSVLYQWNDLEAAAPHLQRALELGELERAWWRIHCYRMQACLKRAQGDLAAAYDYVDRACAIREALTFRQVNISAQPSLEQLRILLSRTGPEMSHLLEDAVQRMGSLGLDAGDDLTRSADFADADYYAHEADFADFARVLVATGEADKALPLIDRLVVAAQSMGRQGDAIRYLVLQALAFHSTGEKASALAALNPALILGEPEGYVRVFVDEGEPMAELLQAASGQRPAVSQTYVDGLLLALGDVTKDRSARRVTRAERSTSDGRPPEGSALVEPLSERELEVLRLMAAGLKYKEVAEELVISLNTVRHHTRNIYGKLDVHNRSQAIAKARNLDLL